MLGNEQKCFPRNQELAFSLNMQRGGMGLLCDFGTLGLKIGASVWSDRAFRSYVIVISEFWMSLCKSVGCWSQDGPKMASRPSTEDFLAIIGSSRSQTIRHKSPSFKRTSTVASRLGAKVPILVVGLSAERKSTETSKQTH